jgi:hypothetical protein
MTAGEVLQQRDLLFGELPDFLAVGGNGPEHGAVLEQRDGEDGARAAKFDQSPAHGADNRLRRDIIDLHVGSAAQQELVAAPGLPGDTAPALELSRSRPARAARQPHGSTRRRRSITCRRPPRKVQSLVENCIEHRCEIAGRGIDDTEHLGVRSLLGKRLITFGFEFVALCRQLGQLALKITDGLLEMGQ